MEVSGKKANRIASLVLLIFVILLSSGVVFLVFRYEDLNDRYEKLYLTQVNERSKTSADGGSVDVNNDSNNDKDSTTRKEYISRDEALDVVLKDLKLEKDDLYDLDIELENKMKYENTIFEISFDYDRYEYEYYVDAVTGEILDSFQSRD